MPQVRLRHPLGLLGRVTKEGEALQLSRCRGLHPIGHEDGDPAVTDLLNVEVDPAWSVLGTEGEGAPP